MNRFVLKYREVCRATIRQKLAEVRANRALAQNLALCAQLREAQEALRERNNRGTGYLYVPKAQYDAKVASLESELQQARSEREGLRQKGLGIAKALIGYCRRMGVTTTDYPELAELESALAASESWKKC